MGRSLGTSVQMIFHDTGRLLIVGSLLSDELHKVQTTRRGRDHLYGPRVSGSLTCRGQVDPPPLGETTTIPLV